MEEENTSKEIKKEWSKRFNKIDKDLYKLRETINQIVIEFNYLPTHSEIYDARLHQLAESLRDSIRGSFLLSNQISCDLNQERFIGEE